jgi:hypothetical protein
LNRKNALFYKTLEGAQVGDLFMSLIHSCELNGANPFDYLTELQRHSAELRAGAFTFAPAPPPAALRQLRRGAAGVPR